MICVKTCVQASSSIELFKKLFIHFNMLFQSYLTMENIYSNLFLFNSDCVYFKIQIFETIKNVNRQVNMHP